MNNLIKNFMQAPRIELKHLDNFFIELSRQSCNLKCKHCYIERNNFGSSKDFLDIKKIKNALKIVKDYNVKLIYLTGGEPTIHPDFNQIMRMCLKISSVCVLTNGQTTNEKKARFLRKIDDESDFESIYVISFEHFDELKNDTIRGRGSYRKAVNAINSLSKYGFNPIVQTTNYYKESEEILKQGFKNLYEKLGLEFQDINLKISPLFSNFREENHNFEEIKADERFLDCANSRILTSSGIYSCPQLAGDFRARSGPDISNFSKKCTLDTKFCSTCLKHGKKAFSMDWI